MVKTYGFVCLLCVVYTYKYSSVFILIHISILLFVFLYKYVCYIKSDEKQKTTSNRTAGPKIKEI